MAQALGPIVADIVKERGANLVLDKQAVVYANSNAFEITADAIARLDAKLPNYKVVLGRGAAGHPFAITHGRPPLLPQSWAVHP